MLNQPRALCRATAAAPLAALALAALLLTPRAASAGHDIAAQVSFWAYSANGAHILLFIDDENRGPVLGVKAVGKQKWVLQVPTNGQPPQALLVQPPLAKFRFADGGVKSPDSPNGWAKIVGTPSPQGFQLFMTNGDKMQPMFTLPYRVEPTTGARATASVKEIVWSANGAAATIVLNQTLEGPYGLDIDQVISFKSAYFLSKLSPPKK